MKNQTLTMKGMKNMKAAGSAWLVLAAVVVSACSSGPGPVDDSGHHDRTRAMRIEKDLWFRASDESPLLPEARATFTALSYYDIRPEFRVPSFLTLESAGPPVVIQLETSTGVMRRMRKVGALGFALGATKYRLTAFADADTRTVDRLFVPFGDLTNKDETYGGGRYLDLDRTPTGLYNLDFNRAYHPYCVYNPNTECPVPPRENRLQVAIPAGERLPPNGGK
jgi:hypothetical protein